MKVEKLNRKVGSVLVIGGGIGGMQASLDLAESGFLTYLMDAAPSIGGNMAHLDKTFPTNDCAMCIISPKLVECGKHINIKIITCGEVRRIDGDAGNFEVTIARLPRYIEAEKCTGCGECAKHCPVTAIDTFNENLSNRKAAYILYPQAVPRVFIIDRERCIGCGLCEHMCLANAIKYDDREELERLKVGSIIAAPGFELFNAYQKPEYGYGHYTNVVTSFEMERMFSASGPYKGHVLRSSDGKFPEKIAWIQCVGSRDSSINREYCSSVCCTYATKQAILAKDHYRDNVSITIFYNDLRTFGKGFDQYYNAAVNKYGVRYIRSMISTIKETPREKNLLIKYVSDEGEVKEEEFNLVVLSMGLVPSASINKLAGCLNIELNEFGFSRTNQLQPGETSREGIYVTGVFESPKDIPETVMTASSAAALSSELLYEVRGTMITKKEYPQERDVTGEELRIGVFICRCGINIAGVVDVPAVVEYAKTLPQVFYAEENLYTCSTDTQANIRNAIIENNLNRVVVASCSPRTHESLFQETCKEAGLNKYLFEMANIRDQCSWVHASYPEKATEKAKDLVRMAVSRAATLEGLAEIPFDVKQKGLVVGGGLAGMNAALTLANQGYETHLIEKSDHLGGNALNLYYTLEEREPQRYLRDLINRTEGHERISVYKNANVLEYSGHVGNFTTLIEVNGKKLELEHGIVIIATGGVEYKPNEYLYGESDRVVTQVELESKLIREEDRFKSVKSVLMIQCVGSRDEEHPYCSRVCCSAALKNALRLKKINPDIVIYILYRDIRAYAFKELYYKKAREAGINFIRYSENKKPEVSLNNRRLKTIVFDQEMRADIGMETDLIVLSAAIRPHPENEKLATTFKLPLTPEGFFLEAHMKLRPLDFANTGMFLCGLAHSPKFIDESIAQAKGAASRAATILSQRQMLVGGAVSVVDGEQCAACLTCVRVCPYDLPVINAEGVAEIEAASCHGCGICASACPRKAIQVQHYKDEQILSKCVAL